MSSPLNDIDASTRHNPRGSTAVGGGFAASGRRKKSAPPTPQNKLPKLTGIDKFILPIVSTQRVRFGTTMVHHAKAMLKLVQEIRGRLETRAELDGTFVDTNDIDPDTGTGRTKKFIPNNLRRQKMPLNHSKRVKKDSRCASAYGEITTILERAKEAHDNYKRQMAEFACQIADSEILARKQILFCMYSTAAVDIAEGFVKKGKYILKSPPQRLSELEVAHAALSEAWRQIFEDEEEDHFLELPFVMSAESETLERFSKKFQEYSGVKMEEIQNKLTALADGESHHPDEQLVSWVAEEVAGALPKLTTDFWQADLLADDDAKLDAEYDELFSKKEQNEANNRLEDAMETDEGESMHDYIGKTVSREMDRRITNRRKDARKKSSGSAKSQASARTANGRGSGKKSKKNGKPSRKRSERSSETDGDNTEDETYESPRQRQRRYESEIESEDEPPPTRTRPRERGRPKSILRQDGDDGDRSVSWGANESREYTPRDEEDRPRKGRGHGRPRGRGGRGGSNGGKKPGGKQRR